jgi:hypothetical protein
MKKRSLAFSFVAEGIFIALLVAHWQSIFAKSVARRLSASESALENSEKHRFATPLPPPTRLAIATNPAQQNAADQTNNVIEVIFYLYA